MGFPRPEYWSGFPFRSPGDLPDPGIEPRFPALQVDFFLPSEPPGKPYIYQDGLKSQNARPEGLLCLDFLGSSGQISQHLWASIFLPTKWR